MLRRVFGPKRDEVTGGWIKLHNEEFYNLYSSPSIIRMIKLRSMRWAGNVVLMGEKGTHIDFGGKARSKETRPRRKWVDNIKMYDRDVECGGMDWTDLVQYRDQWINFVNTVMNLRVP
jgi:hypothetical protein